MVVSLLGSTSKQYSIRPHPVGQCLWSPGPPRAQETGTETVYYVRMFFRVMPVKGGMLLTYQKRI